MRFENNRFQPEFEMGFLSDREADVRRDPNYTLVLFLIILGVFAVALVAIFYMEGQLPIFE